MLYLQHMREFNSSGTGQNVPFPYTTYSIASRSTFLILYYFHRYCLVVLNSAHYMLSLITNYHETGVVKEGQ